LWGGNLVLFQIHALTNDVNPLFVCEIIPTPQESSACPDAKVNGLLYVSWVPSLTSPADDTPDAVALDARNWASSSSSESAILLPTVQASQNIVGRSV